MILLDIDNCIADDAWRIPRINWHLTGDARYHDYHLLAPFDKARNERLHGYEGRKVIIMTGRPVTYRAATEEWLRRVAGIVPAHLLMRNANDARPSVEVKQAQLRSLIHHYGVRLDHIEAAYDDRPDIVQMYERNGVRGARAVAIHDVNAYFNPLTQEHVA